MCILCEYAMGCSAHSAVPAIATMTIVRVQVARQRWSLLNRCARAAKATFHPARIDSPSSGLLKGQIKSFMNLELGGPCTKMDACEHQRRRTQSVMLPQVARFRHVTPRLPFSLSTIRHNHRRDQPTYVGSVCPALHYLLLNAARANPKAFRPFGAGSHGLQIGVLAFMMQIDGVGNSSHRLKTDEIPGLSFGRWRRKNNRRRVLGTEKGFHLLAARFN